MTSPETKRELFELADAVLAGDATAEQASRLEQLVLADPAAQQAYFRYVEDTLHLKARAEEPLSCGELDAAIAGSAEADAADGPPAPLAGWTSPGYWRQHRWQFAAVALAATLLIWAGFFGAVLPWGQDAAERDVARTDRASKPLVATITDMHQVVWETDAMPWEWGAKLRAGRKIQIQAGLMELTFSDGARTILQGPCLFSVDAPGAGTLEKGKLSATAEGSAVDFTVVTPVGRIRDLGTQFGVAVDDQGATEVQVVVGRVEVRVDRPAEVASSSHVLSAGEGMRISADGAWTNEIPEPTEFAQKMPRRPNDIEPGTARIDYNDFRPGVPAGQLAGAGFAASDDWSGVAQSILVVPGDLSAPVETHYALQQTGPAQSLQGTWQGEGNRQDYRRLARPLQGDVVWFSLLIRNEDANSSAGLALNDTNTIAEAAPIVQSSGPDLLVNGQTAAESVFTQGKTTLVVGRITVADIGPESIDVWVNPDLSGGAAGLGRPTGSVTANILDRRGISVLGSVAFRNGVLDMIHISDRASGFADVTGVVDEVAGDAIERDE
jgi:hypothetical protein